MSSSTAIAYVSQTIQSLLQDGFEDLTISILPLDRAGQGSDSRINLFLYKIEENPYLKNKDWLVSPDNPNQIVPPPLSVNLYYLITAYTIEDSVMGLVGAQQLLGEAMRILHQNPVLPEESMPVGLQGAFEQIKIAKVDLDLDEVSKIWGVFDTPYRLSVAYEVSVIQIDQEPDEVTPMPPRVSTIGPASISAGHAPPGNIQLVTPSVLPGGNVSFFGENIDGWSATISINRQQIANRLAITGSNFTVAIPIDIGPGFHEIRVDISGLHRATFFIEVLDE